MILNARLGGETDQQNVIMQKACSTEILMLIVCKCHEWKEQVRVTVLTSGFQKREKGLLHYFVLFCSPTVPFYSFVELKIANGRL